MILAIYIATGVSARPMIHGEEKRRANRLRHLFCKVTGEDPEFRTNGAVRQLPKEINAVWKICHASRMTV
jgi:hypothetical protein